MQRSSKLTLFCFNALKPSLERLIACREEGLTSIQPTTLCSYLSALKRPVQSDEENPSDDKLN